MLTFGLHGIVALSFRLLMGSASRWGNLEVCICLKRYLPKHLNTSYFWGSFPTPCS